MRQHQKRDRVTDVNWSKSDPSASLSNPGFSLQVTEKIRVELLTTKRSGKKISVGIKAELQGLLQQTRTENPRLGVGRKEQRQRERPWKLVWAWTWPLSAGLCKQGRSCQCLAPGLGLGVEAGRDAGTASQCETSFSHGQEMCTTIPSCECQAGLQEQGRGKEYKTPRLC